MASDLIRSHRPLVSRLRIPTLRYDMPPVAESPNFLNISA